MRKLPKDVLKMASGLILPSGLAGHRRPLCIGAAAGSAAANVWDLLAVWILDNSPPPQVPSPTPESGHV